MLIKLQKIQLCNSRTGINKYTTGSNQSILKEVNPEYSLEGLMLKLKFLILQPLDAKAQHIGKDPDAGKD